jgi:hypothetical protein
MVDSDFRRRSQRSRKWLVLAVLLLALAAAVWVWHATANRRAPDPHRGEMYQRTLESVRSTCLPPKAGVESYCRDQALLLLEFPECDSACVALARKIRGEPTR